MFNLCNIIHDAIIIIIILLLLSILAAKHRWRVTAILMIFGDFFLSTHHNPPLLNGKGRSS